MLDPVAGPVVVVSTRLAAFWATVTEPVQTPLLKMAFSGRTGTGVPVEKGVVRPGFVIPRLRAAVVQLAAVFPSELPMRA